MEIKTKYHGIKHYKDSDVITFKKGIPGFENLKKFIIFPVEENNLFYVLQSIEDLSIGLVLISPFNILKDYEFDLDDSKMEELGIKSHKDIIVFNTVTLNSKIENITANLKAPFVININKKIGEQIILDGSSYSIKYPLFKEENWLLVISRKKGESLLIGDDIEITVSKIEDGSVKLSISAPKSVTILRKELYKEVEKENRSAAASDMSLLKKFKK